MAAYIKAKDTDDYLAVIDVAKRADDFDSMVKYLVMVRKKVKEPKVDSELCYAYAKTGQLAELEEFISQPNATKLDNIGERCFDEGLYEAAKVLFTTASNWGRLAAPWSSFTNSPTLSTRLARRTTRAPGRRFASRAWTRASSGWHSCAR